MPRQLPGWKRATLLSVSLVMLASMALTPRNSSCAERELMWVSPSRTTTLDAYIAPQTSRLDSTLIDSIDQGIALKRQPHTKREINSKPKSSWKQVGTVPNRKESRPTPVAQAERKADDRESPFDKWLSTEDVEFRDTTTRSDTTAAVPVEKPAKKTASRDVGAQKTAAPMMEIRSPERLALRFRRRVIEPPQQKTYVPQETMHPTEKQRDDRRGPVEPPVGDLPSPDSDDSEAASSSHADELPPLSKWQIQLRTKIRRVLTHYYNRPLSTHDRSPWEVMHSMLAFEVNSKVLRSGPNAQPITAVGWLCFNQPCKRRTLMYVNDEGELRVRVGPALQGHRGQLLAMLAQAKVRQDYPMRVEGHELTVADLIEMEKSTCYTRSELTFKLIGLMQYLPSDSQWVNDQGMEWNLPKLVNEELRQPIRGAACGGTHRLSGLTLAYKKRQQRGEPVDGEYLRAQRFVTQYQQYAYRLQNSDGSFSTEWFRGPGNEEDIDRKLKTTGHILEWLLYASTEKELKYSRTTKAANYLATIMYNNRNKDWEAGPLGHALHALLLYDRLVFSPYDAPGETPIAGRTQQSSFARSRR